MDRKGKAPQMSMYNPYDRINPAFDPHSLPPMDPPSKADAPLVIKKGRYIDIANAKNKNPNILYFGTSLSTSKLSGLFLGDLEITSRIKDVSLFTTDTEGINELIVTFINASNKLLSIKTTFTTATGFENLKQELIDLIGQGNEAINSSIEAINERIDGIDSSIDDLQGQIDDVNDDIQVIDSSIDDIYEHLEIIDSSITALVEELDTRFNYNVRLEEGDFSEGYKKTYSLYNGDNKVEDSSSIEILDYMPKEFSYDKDTNSIKMVSWPEGIDARLKEGIIGYDADGNPITAVIEKLNPDLIKEVSANMDDFVDYIDDFMDSSDSKLGYRVQIIENELEWRDLN